MTLSEFKTSLQKSEPPRGINTLLQALWHDAKEDWHMAHNLAQEIETSEGSWIHAYLHRKEGDESNARYWYSRAGRKFPKSSLSEEWEEIASTLIADSKI
jgi:hypothetical protein